MENENSKLSLNSDLMTTKEAALFLRISKQRLLNLVSSGQIPYYKLGRSNRYSKQELILTLETQRRGPKVV